MEDDYEINVTRMVMMASNPAVTATMRRFAAAAAIMIAGKPGRRMRAPEPLVQVGFEPGASEMHLLMATAQAEGRDLIHISCHADGTCKPTGMIAIVCLEDGQPRAHRRGGLLCASDGGEVFLGGVSDVEDELCYFVLRPGAKMIRCPGLTLDDLGARINRAAERWFACAERLEPVDFEHEIITIYGLVRSSSIDQEVH